MRLDILLGTSMAVDQLHEVPVIHRDIKPENFLLKGGFVKLSDFGLADFGRTGQGKTGTNGYVAPEVIESEKRGDTYTNKCDVWSLGAVLHEVKYYPEQGGQEGALGHEQTHVDREG